MTESTGAAADHRIRRRSIPVLALVLAALVLLVGGCGEEDPGALGPVGLDAGRSAEARKQDYVDGVQRSLQQFGNAQGASYQRAVEGGDRRGLQIAAVAWDQGVAGLKQQDPPKDAVEAHRRLIAATEALKQWNARIIDAAPNKASTRKLARQASRSRESRAFGAAVCDLVSLGYPVVEGAACSPLDTAGGAGGDAVGAGIGG